MPEIVDMLQHYLCPDELFMQTLVRNSSRFRPDEIRSRNAHFRQGDPVWVTDDLADEILASGAFFARKVAFDRSPQLLDRVRRIIL
jgi:hypothetical protein